MSDARQALKKIGLAALLKNNGEHFYISLCRLLIKIQQTTVEVSRQLVKNRWMLISAELKEEFPKLSNFRFIFLLSFILSPFAPLVRRLHCC